MTNEINVTLKKDISIEYWNNFQKMFLQYDIYADHQEKEAIDIWFDEVLT